MGGGNLARGFGRRTRRTGIRTGLHFAFPSDTIFFSFSVARRYSMTSSSLGLITFDFIQSSTFKLIFPFRTYTATHAEVLVPEPPLHTKLAVDQGS